MSRCMIVLLFCVAGVEAQEARTGFDLAATVSGGAFYSHQLASGPVNGGLRSVLYPTLKLSDRWSASASLQIASSPYFYEQFSNPKREVSASLLQGHVAYTRFSGNRSFSFRAGQLSSAFGSFLLRYDDAVNPLIDMPMAYGYYYKSVTTRGLPGVQIDATAGKFDVRGQFTNSSPANPRTLLQSDQYGSYTAGGGYTIRQGFRVGASFNRGAYLHRQHAFYFPGEARPHDLPATSFGVDVQYGHGPWNLNGEWQYHNRDYKAIPVFIHKTGYAEIRRVVHPRVYVAARFDHERPNAYPGRELVEFAIGFRPNRYQLLKTGYQMQHGPAIRGTLGNTFAIQLVTSIHPVSLAIH